MERLSDTRYRLRQERYLLDSDSKGKDTPSPYGYKWEVPITWISNLNPSAPKQQWLKSTDEFMDLTVASGTQWVKFNVGQFGYYRVNYPKDMWIQFSQRLLENPNQFSE